MTTTIKNTEKFEGTDEQAAWESYAESRDCSIRNMGAGVFQSIDASLNVRGAFYTLDNNVPHGFHQQMSIARNEK